MSMADQHESIDLGSPSVEPPPSAAGLSWFPAPPPHIYSCTLTPDLVTKAREELQEKPEWRLRDVQALRDMILKVLLCAVMPYSHEHSLSSLCTWQWRSGRAVWKSTNIPTRSPFPDMSICHFICRGIKCYMCCPDDVDHIDTGMLNCSKSQLHPQLS